MKHLQILIILTFLFTLSCQTTNKKQKLETSRVELVPEPDKDLRLEYERKKQLFEMSNDSLWVLLAFQNGGCLTGGQYVHEGKFGGEGCVMTKTEEWKIFLKREKYQLSNFLISKLTDTMKTKIHTCPFSVATEGELATYALQSIYKINWYDFEEFNEYKERKPEGSLSNHQRWLQEILKDEKKKESVINNWKEQANK